MNFQMALEKLSFLKKRFKVIFFKKEKNKVFPLIIKIVLITPRIPKVFLPQQQ